MLIRNGTITGADINFTSPTDVLGPFKSAYMCSLLMSYHRVFFQHCTLNMVPTALSVTQWENNGNNDQNAGLHIVDPRDPWDQSHKKWMDEFGIPVENINPDDWVMIQGMTFDFCNVPVFIFGRGCSITHGPPQNMNLRKYTIDDWRYLEDRYGAKELGRMIAANPNQPKLLPSRAERRRQRKAL